MRGLSKRFLGPWFTFLFNAPILFVDGRQIVNKLVIVQLVQETEENFNEGL